jgi:hypothetical protein
MLSFFIFFFSLSFLSLISFSGFILWLVGVYGDQWSGWRIMSRRPSLSILARFFLFSRYRH